MEFVSNGVTDVAELRRLGLKACLSTQSLSLENLTPRHPDNAETPFPPSDFGAGLRAWHASSMRRP